LRREVDLMRRRLEKIGIYREVMRELIGEDAREDINHDD